MSYLAASDGRRLAHWMPASGDANRHLLASLGKLRNRSREQYRNNPWIKAAINALVSNEIGAGVKPRPATEDKDFNNTLRQLYQRWQAVCDAAGTLNFNGLQAQITRARVLSGECFVRYRYRSAAAGLPVALQLQVLESDFVPADMHKALSGGRYVRAGIEFNRQGRRVAYYVYTSHPHGLESGIKLVRIPAGRIIHHYSPTRPGQLRGEPIAATSLLKAKTFDQYDDAELRRKESRSALTGFIKKSYSADSDWGFDPVSGEQLEDNASEPKELKIESGSFAFGYPGEEPVLFDGDSTGSGYADFMRQQLLAIAAGFGVPYELLTGDWSKVNDRLVRAILNEFRRSVQASQEHLMIAQVCQPVYRAMIDHALITGVLDAPAAGDMYKCDWRVHAHPYVHPLQDVDAKIKAIDAGLTSRDAAIAESGRDGEDIDAQRAAEAARWQKLRA